MSERRCVATKNQFQHPIYSERPERKCGETVGSWMHDVSACPIKTSSLLWRKAACWHHEFQPAEEAQKEAKCECGHEKDQHSRYNYVAGLVCNAPLDVGKQTGSCPCTFYIPHKLPEGPKPAAEEAPKEPLARVSSLVDGRCCVELTGEARTSFGDHDAWLARYIVDAINQHAEEWYQRRRKQESTQPCLKCEWLAEMCDCGHTRQQHAEGLLSCEYSEGGQYDEPCLCDQFFPKPKQSTGEGR